MKFYVVKKGRQPGIYFDWPTCLKQVNHFSGAVYKSFLNLEDAEAYLGVKKVKMGGTNTQLII